MHRWLPFSNETVEGRLLRGKCALCDVIGDIMFVACWLWNCTQSNDRIESKSYSYDRGDL